jgi:RNA polymerase sigma-70 factor (ECF subfamily)
MPAAEDDLRSIARGDRNAFTRLYRASRQDLVRYATGVLAGDRAGAEDAVDDAFVAIWTQAGQYDGSGSAHGWMRRIVRNKAIDWLRKQRETAMSGEPIMADHCNRVADEATPFDSVMQKSAAAALRRALGALSFEQREAVWLCYFEDKSIKEIAEISRCPENTVKTRLFHARLILGKTYRIRELRSA